MQPKPRAETSRPLFPSIRCFIVAPSGSFTGAGAQSGRVGEWCIRVRSREVLQVTACAPSTWIGVSYIFGRLSSLHRVRTHLREPARLVRPPPQPISRRDLLRGAASGIATLALGM